MHISGSEQIITTLFIQSDEEISGENWFEHRDLAALVDLCFLAQRQVVLHPKHIAVLCYSFLSSRTQV